MKQVFAPHLGRNIKFGRRAPAAPGPHFRLGHYLDAGTLPPPPSSLDMTPKAMASLRNVMQNDSLGDCVVAGGYHVEGIATGNAGTIFVPSDAQVVADYSKIGNYVPGDPTTDNGCQLTDALNFWTTHGFANGTKLAGWLAVDPSNRAEVEQACWLFENLYMGMGLPDDWVSQQNFPQADGFTWDVAGPADTNNGHCVATPAQYSALGVGIASWGLLGWLTWAALTRYTSSPNGGELYVMLTPDQLAKGQAKAPNGFAWADLVADFNRLGGHVPVPAPPPLPQPSASRTLAQAQAALALGWR